MKLRATATATTLALLAMVPSAHAAGIGLRWGSCEGTANRVFACDRITGTEVLVASFSAPSGVSELTGIEAYLRITTADGKIPPWWQVVNSGSCRSSSLSAQPDVSDLVDCDDPWEGQAMGGIARYLIDGSEGVDLLLGFAIPQDFKHPLASGRTYGAFKLVINHQRTTGAGACTGCETPACITLERMVIAQYSEPDPETRETKTRENELTVGLPGSGTTPGNVATWQGGTANCGMGLTRPSSWGELKKRFHH